MGKIALILLLSVSVGSFAQSGLASRKMPLKVTKFGTTFEDDYTWLENPKSDKFRQWKTAQNEAFNH